MENNYSYTTEPGTTRRRAKRIIVESPAEPIDITKPRAFPTIIFETEDRVILQNGKEIFVPGDNVTLVITPEILMKQYASIDMASGSIDMTKMRRGYEIVATCMKALGDVFITEAMEQDARFAENKSKK